MLVSTKTTTLHEHNIRAASMEILVSNFCMCLDETFGATRATQRNVPPCDTFIRNYEPNRVPEMSLSYFQNMPTYYPSGKYKLLVR